ncbi:type VI secretion protein ImpB [Alteriqipengyuania sp.]|uniref:Y-family DNA polymerase n=1 Tax=Alteriqipengyuania sp. TaxID=2800692 RepID=UPI0035169DD7
MRKPDTVEHLYLDFDGFFASVEQQVHPRLRGRPVGVIPFSGPSNRIIIACSKEAKALGVSNVMTLEDARAACPDILLVPQSPHLYRRAHNALLAEIESVVPIDVIKSIDELSCRLDPAQRTEPLAIASRIKATVAENVGPYITSSIGFAANRHLAKIACKMDKPDGVTVWHPHLLPEQLFTVPLPDIPGVGSRMVRRLCAANIITTEDLYRTQPKQMRKLWRNVTGERLWYALHGYEIEAPQSKRGMFGHGRVLPPDVRTPGKAREIARVLLVKAARRMRREGYYCSGLWLWAEHRAGRWSEGISLPVVHDDAALLAAFGNLWAKLCKVLGPRPALFRIGVTLYDLSPADRRQLDFLLDDDSERQRWEAINRAIDELNTRYGCTICSVGFWPRTSQENIGGKISYTRIPNAEDFW